MFCWSIIHKNSLFLCTSNTLLGMMSFTFSALPSTWNICKPFLSIPTPALPPTCTNAGMVWNHQLDCASCLNLSCHAKYKLQFSTWKNQIRPMKFLNVKKKDIDWLNNRALDRPSLSCSKLFHNRLTGVAVKDIIPLFFIITLVTFCPTDFISFCGLLSPPQHSHLCCHVSQDNHTHKHSNARTQTHFSESSQSRLSVKYSQSS